MAGYISKSPTELPNAFIKKTSRNKSGIISSKVPHFGYFIAAPEQISKIRREIKYDGTTDQT